VQPLNCEWRLLWINIKSSSCNRLLIASLYYKNICLSIFQVTNWSTLRNSIFILIWIETVTFPKSFIQQNSVLYMKFTSSFKTVQEIIGEQILHKTYSHSQVQVLCCSPSWNTYSTKPFISGKYLWYCWICIFSTVHCAVSVRELS
jgi:hypothetical protein